MQNTTGENRSNSIEFGAFRSHAPQRHSIFDRNPAKNARFPRCGSPICQHKDLGVFKKNTSFNVGPHATVLLRATPQDWNCEKGLAIYRSQGKLKP
jgi:hypothetical protein